MSDEILTTIPGLEDAAAVPEVLSEKYLLFTAGGLLFGAKAEYIVEILTNHAITHLPLVPEHIRGIINLRGQILPIVDIRLMLGRPAGDDSCIIILNMDGTMVGILVDSVQRMIDVSADSILPSPDQNSQGLASGMYSLSDGQTMLVFDCPQLLSRA